MSYECRKRRNEIIDTFTVLRYVLIVLVVPIVRRLLKIIYGISQSQYSTRVYVGSKRRDTIQSLILLKGHT
jgi:hypothetical protein